MAPDCRMMNRDTIPALSGGIEGYHESLRIVGVPSEIRTEHAPGTSLERNLYTNLFGTVHCWFGPFNAIQYLHCRKWAPSPDKNVKLLRTHFENMCTVNWSWSTYIFPLMFIWRMILNHKNQFNLLFTQEILSGNKNGTLLHFHIEVRTFLNEQLPVLRIHWRGCEISFPSRWPDLTTSTVCVCVCVCVGGGTTSKVKILLHRYQKMWTV
jgi:hypothetical protein